MIVEFCGFCGSIGMLVEGCLFFGELGRCGFFFKY